MSTCSLFSFTRFVVPVDANRDLQSVNALMGILAFRLLRRTALEWPGNKKALDLQWLE